QRVVDAAASLQPTPLVKVLCPAEMLVAQGYLIRLARRRELHPVQGGPQFPRGGKSHHELPCMDRVPSVAKYRIHRESESCLASLRRLCRACCRVSAPAAGFFHRGQNDVAKSLRSQRRRSSRLAYLLQEEKSGRALVEHRGW